MGDHEQTIIEPVYSTVMDLVEGEGPIYSTLEEIYSELGHYSRVGRQAPEVYQRVGVLAPEQSQTISSESSKYSVFDNVRECERKGELSRLGWSTKIQGFSKNSLQA